VIGGAGFIGRQLVERLVESGHEVRVGDIVPAEPIAATFQLCDVRDSVAVHSFVGGLDLIYNLAAEHRDDVRPLSRYHSVNVDGASVLCDAARAADIKKIVFTSSVAVYGLAGIPADEKAPCRPFNEYGRTKLEAERVYRAWAGEAGDRALVIVRPTAVFGKGAQGNINNLARQIEAGRFVMIGDGRNRKAIAYVENVADFLLHSARFGPGVHFFNYADGEPEMNELVASMRASLGKGRRVGVRLPYAFGYAVGRACDVLARATGRQLAVSTVRVQKFCAESRIVSRRAFETGFTPSFTLATALERCLAQEFPKRAEQADTSQSEETPTAPH
jgi:nucleoside-diphosphate-sugar epimerase